MRALLAIAAVVAALLFAPAAPLQAADGASFDDTAKFLAGQQPSANSPLAEMAREPAWQQHARHFDATWTSLDGNQLARARDWSAKNMTEPSKTLFYMFSGPDFLYASIFFPKASTYVLSGLERVGPIPDVTRMKANALSSSFGHLKVSLRYMLGHSYFITSQMGSHLSRGQLNGTLPILYVFLARTGKTIRDVSYVELEPDGSIKPFDASVPKAMPRAVKITFTSGSGPEQTLYYFSTNLADAGVSKSGFLKFCETLRPGDGLVKSASYLLHGSGFSNVRRFLLDNTAHILQDDTGVPVSFFKDDDWALQAFGRYTRPIPVFSGRYQSRLKALFDKDRPAPLQYSLGYRWRVGESNLMLATRKSRPAATMMPRRSAAAD
jgi:hypothetical protein